MLGSLSLTKFPYGLLSWSRISSGSCKI